MTTLRYLSCFCILILSCGNTESGPPVFDGDRAFRYLEKQCEFGPRVPGTIPHMEMEEWLRVKLEMYAEEVVIDTFSVDLTDSTSLELRNYMAGFNLRSERRILLCAHYDTRPIADKDPDPLKRDQPIMGANDGASGVAVLLELAHLFSEQTPDIGIDLVFFDGEDYGESYDQMLFGSKRFASKNIDYSPLFGILLDMVGEKDLRVYQELFSLEGSPEIVKRVWNLAKKIGLEEVFIPVPRHAVIDDHIPLLQSGIRCINIIDFDYPYWHTMEDTPDKCSGKSLKSVGDVLIQLIYGEDL